LVAVILVWWLLAALLMRPIVPSPFTVFLNIGEIFAAKMSIHLLYSLGRIIAGILVSVLIGVPLGFLM